MAEKITFISMNCQGLGDKAKRKDVLHFLKQKKHSIYLLQDTHFTEKEEKYIRTQWGYDCYFSSFSSQSRGVSTMLNPNFEHKVTQVKKDNEGNKLILEIFLPALNKNITLVNIYGPNRDKPNFYKQVREDINNLKNDHIIVAGDLNIVLNPENDTQGYLHVNNPRARETLIDLCNETGLIDIWRETHMEEKQFTWRKNNGNKKARLDYFLISENLFNEIDKSDILGGYRTDHSMIFLQLIKGEEEKNRTFWKFNNSLLKDKEYVKIVKDTISKVKRQYISPNILENTDINIENLSNAEIQLVINDQLFLEVLLMEIRGKTISYASHKKKLQDRTEQHLIKDIDKLQKENTPNSHTILQAKQKELYDIRNKKLQGKFIRSRANWIDLGEKPSNYFCHLESRNFVSKNMPNLIKDDGLETTNTQEVVNETKSFYEKLYSARDILDYDITRLLHFSDIPKLNELQKEDLEGEITYNEMLAALKLMKNNKSPGSDGFTTEFIKFFWNDIGYFVVRSINHGYKSGELSATQKEGVIVCLPKGNKNKKYLKNWRPISLLNVTYKLASACIANRIKKTLPHLIHTDQTGFISGRFMGENIRNIYDLFKYTEKNNIPGLLLLIDFEKAFDSVAWSYINKVFNFFNFGESVKRWVSTFYKNIKSCVIVNNKVSAWFDICRGCRQGDPLSPYIFVLCAEILALLIRKHRNIKGITINKTEFLISQYSDDTSLTLEPTEICLKNTLMVLKFYAKASGLYINYEKTRLIWFGSMRGSTRTLNVGNNFNLNWDQGEFTLLGIKFTTNLNDMIKINYNEKIREIKNVLLQWSKRILTPFGKIVVIKTLALSKINHLISALPNPPENILNEINSMFYKFLWNGSRDRIKRKIITKPYAQGGLKMVNIFQFVKALKLTWVRRFYMTENNPNWLQLLMHQCPNITDFTKYGDSFIKDIKGKIRNFWNDVFDALLDFLNTCEVNTDYDFQLQPLWYNSKIKVGGKSNFYKQWAQKGILFVNDLLDCEGKFLTHNKVSELYQVNINYLSYHGLVKSLENIRKNLNKTFKRIPQPIQPLIVSQITKDRKGCKLFYNNLINNNENPTAQNKWIREVNLPNSFNWHKVYNLLHRTTKDTNLKWLQFRIVHRILSTNTFLTKIGILDSNLCDMCKEVPETLQHVFWECPKTQEFWTALRNLLQTKCENIQISNFTALSVIFGFLTEENNNNEILNLILQYAKLYIYRSKLANILPTIGVFKKLIVSIYETEKCIAYTTCTWDNFTKQWQPFIELVRAE